MVTEPEPQLPAVPFTYEDYRYLPNDGRRYEIAFGEIYVTPAPSPLHQTISRRLQHTLMTQLEDRGIALIFNAPIDVILSNTTIVQPDLALLAVARQHLISERGIEGPPDIVAEILSPSTRGNDEHLKRSVYAHFGVQEYWLVDPDHGWVEQLRLAETGYQLARRFDRASTLTTPVFREVGIELGSVFLPLETR